MVTAKNNIYKALTIVTLVYLTSSMKGSWGGFRNDSTAQTIIKDPRFILLFHSTIFRVLVFIIVLGASWSQYGYHCARHHELTQSCPRAGSRMRARVVR